MKRLAVTLLLLPLLLACGPRLAEPHNAAPTPQCVQGGMISLHVVNQNPGDVRLFFDGWNQLAAVPGFSEKTIRVPEDVVRNYIGLQVVRGGMGRAVVNGGVVDCNDATLLIGSAINQSYFFGADVRR